LCQIVTIYFYTLLVNLTNFTKGTNKVQILPKNAKK